ncbi:MAG: hypothetical protein H6Q15_2228 [Bacteroidetes bacterium]|nr:hypothetical protein [Bacteroidota bacterium]
MFKTMIFVQNTKKLNKNIKKLKNKQFVNINNVMIYINKKTIK